MKDYQNIYDKLSRKQLEALVIAAAKGLEDSVFGFMFSDRKDVEYMSDKDLCAFLFLVNEFYDSDLLCVRSRAR